MIDEELAYGDDTRAWRLGDSDVVIAITWTRKKGAEGISQFADCCRDLADAMTIALDSRMSEEYSDVYTHMLEDICENGVSMPMEGMIVPHTNREAGVGNCQPLRRHPLLSIRFSG